MGISFPMQAQQVDTTQIYELQQVDVSAEKRPSVVRSLTPVQIVEGEEIARLGYQSLADVVRRFAGVAVKDYGGIGGLKTVSIRSLGANHTAVVYDGIVVSNCQAGQIDIGRFSLDNVARVSLAVGQESHIFQSARMFASAGVLNIQSEIPDFRENRLYGLKAQIKGGSFGLINPAMRYFARLSPRTKIVLDGDFMRADGTYPFRHKNGNFMIHGKRYNSDILSWHSEINLYTVLKDSSHWNTKAYYFDSKRGLPGNIILYNPYAAERLWDKNFFIQSGYEKHFDRKWALKTALKYNYSWNKYRDINPAYPDKGVLEDRHRQQEYYVSATALFRPVEKWVFSLATDGAVNTLRTTVDTLDPVRYSALAAFSARYQYRFLTVTAVILHTWMKDKGKAGNSLADHYKCTPSVGLSLRPWDTQNLYVRFLYKHTFRLPTFNDLYYLRMGNTNLRPEFAREYNVGITWSGAPFQFTDFITFTADVYYNRVDDKIVARPTNYVWKMMNMGKVDITGVDLNFTGDISLAAQIRLSLSANYTWQKAVDVTNPDKENYKDQIPYTPQHTGNGAFALEMPWVSLSYTCIAVGERYSLPQNIEQNLIPGYVEHGLSVSREFEWKNCALRLQAECVNFIDKQYAVIKDYPMPGRSWRFTGRIRF